MQYANELKCTNIRVIIMSHVRILKISWSCLLFSLDNFTLTLSLVLGKNKTKKKRNNELFC